MSTLMETTPVMDEANSVKFMIDANPEGEVTATVPVSWIFDEATLEFIANNRNNSPHLIIIVASYHTVAQVSHDYSAADKALKKAQNAGGDIDDELYESLIKEVDQSFTSYSITSVQSIPLLNRKGLPTTAKTFLRFDRPGENIIIGRVVTIYSGSDQNTVYNWMRRHHDLSVSEATANEPLAIRAYEGEWIMERGHGLSSINVVVPIEMFAKERPKWQKSLVRQFFRGFEDDECHFRKRLWFASIPAAIGVQLYGLIVRLATLLFALVTARRNTFSKMFFAFNPHDYGRSLGSSWWTRDKEGSDRSALRRALSPQGLFKVVVAVGIALLPGDVLAMLWKLLIDTETSIEFPVVVIVALIADVAIVTIVFLCWLLFKRAGRRWFRWNIARPIAGIIEKLVSKKTEGNVGVVVKTSTERDNDVLDQLRRAQASIVAEGEVANTTFVLKFNNLKMKVCRQFAKPQGY